MGDPAGVGPELAAKLLADPMNTQRADILVLADISEVLDAARVANVKVPIASAPSQDAVQVLDDGTAPQTAIERGTISKASGERTLYQLKRAVSLVNEGKADAIVFTPLNKTSLHMAGMHEEDELRWFAMHLKHPGTTSEINIIPGLWTARVTSHVSLKDVSSRITKTGVLDSITLLHQLLSDFGTENPRLGVCALNPHNGENGLFGREEIDVIRPGVAEAQSQGINVQGPFPSDTIFVNRKNYDGIVTMYHDQGQIALKVIGFDGGVTVQGGLPVVIATPAHGTAFDIAGKNIASITSSQNALDVAIAVASKKAARAKRTTSEGSKNGGVVQPVKATGGTKVLVSEVAA
jgi:4-hydroxy-L-threonine phosphate dehydrogenase PdxA